jgi:hypothetical protein
VREEGLAPRGHRERRRGLLERAAGGIEPHQGLVHDGLLAPLGLKHHFSVDGGRAEVRCERNKARDEEETFHEVGSGGSKV